MFSWVISEHLECDIVRQIQILLNIYSGSAVVITLTKI